MKKSKILYWTLQIVSWGVLATIIGVAAALQGEYSNRTFYQLIELYLLLIFISHTIRWVLIKKDWLNLRLILFIPRALTLIVLASALILIIYTSINHIIYKEQWKSFITFFINIILYSIFLILWVAVYLAYHLTQKSRLQEIDNLKLKSNEVQSELKILRNQLNPHFLFNSLNNIRALIEIDPTMAKSAITTLSSLLRNSLLLSKKSFITLQEELKLVDEYLQLEQIRYEERLEYEIQNEIVETVHIPPFLIQGMAENAIKHGISKTSKGGKIKISVRYVNDLLVMEVRNSGKYIENTNNGIGVANTQRRLELIYEGDAGFEIKSEKGWVKASIWIKKHQLNHIK